MTKEEQTRLERLFHWYLEHAPQRVIEATAAVLASSDPLRTHPGWRFDIGADDPRPLTQFRRDIWRYYRDAEIAEPVVYRWYDGIRLRLFLGNDMSLCLYAGRSFEPNEFVLLDSVLGPGMTFIDGGANDGLYSLFAARHVAPEGRVIAVEPSRREYERLLANLQLNRARVVDALPVALGNAPGTAKLAVAQPGHEGQNTLGARVSNPTVETVAHETVELQTIDGVVERCALERVDVIKLDVEGSEVEALSGARATIAAHQPLLIVEAEDERLASQGRTKEDLIAVLRECGYTLWVFDETTAQLREPRRPAEPEGNLIAAPATWKPPRL